MVETLSLYLKNTNIDKYCTFYLSVFLTSIPSKTSILSKYIIFKFFVTYIDIPVRKLVDNIFYFLEKQL